MKDKTCNYKVDQICDTIIEFTCTKRDCNIISEAELYMAERADKVPFFIYKNVDEEKPKSVLIKVGSLT